MVIDDNKHYSKLIDNESDNHTEVQITEAKPKHEVVNCEIVTKCRICQKHTKISIKNISPSIENYNCRDGCRNENNSKTEASQPEQASNVSCSCKCISLARKRSTGIRCPKPDFKEITRPRQACCIHCTNPFRYYSLDEKAHCAHCSIFSKIVLAIAEIIFFVTIFLLLLKFAFGIIDLVYEPIYNSPDNKLSLEDIPKILTAFVSMFIAAGARYLVGDLERPFTIKDFKTKLSFFMNDDKSAASNRDSSISVLGMKTESQIMVAKPVVIKCPRPHCQTLTEVFVKRLLSDTAICNKYSKLYETVIEARPGQEYIHCLCNCLMSAEQHLTEICCPMPNCNRVIKERHPCCTACVDHFMDISLKERTHCLHCNFVPKVFTSITALVIMRCILFLPSKRTVGKLIILADKYAAKLFGYDDDEKLEEESNNLTYDHQSNSPNCSPPIRIGSENNKLQKIDIAVIE